jgi:hypothetical protein
MKRVALTFVDYDAETSTTSVRVTNAADDSLATQLGNAIAAVSTGLLTKRTLSDITQIGTPADVPNDPQVQRESKWLVRAWDTVNFKPVNFEIPCADLDQLEERSNRLDIYTPEEAGETLKDAIESYVLSSDGNAIAVLEIVHVGRNN